MDPQRSTECSINHIDGLAAISVIATARPLSVISTLEISPKGMGSFTVMGVRSTSDPGLEIVNIGNPDFNYLCGVVSPEAYNLREDYTPVDWNVDISKNRPLYISFRESLDTNRFPLDSKGIHDNDHYMPTITRHCDSELRKKATAYLDSQKLFHMDKASGELKSVGLDDLLGRFHVAPQLRLHIYGQYGSFSRFDDRDILFPGFNQIGLCGSCGGIVSHQRYVHQAAARCQSCGLSPLSENKKKLIEMDDPSKH